MIRCFRYFVLMTVLSMSFLPLAHAGGIDALEFKNKQHEQQYQQLIQELRCLVCQNQTIGESNADLAKDMRNIVKKMVEDGQNNETITRFMSDRYGDFVRYHPPLNTRTIILWITPFILIVLTLFLIPKLVKPQRNIALDESQRKQAKDLLEK